MKSIVILGSTGSIGRNALDVVRHFPDKFRVAGLSANSRIPVLLKQIEEFRPSFVCLGSKEAYGFVKDRLKKGIRIFSGTEGLKELAGLTGIDKVVMAISGSAALAPLLSAIEKKKEIALANKEALVMAGPLIMEEARKAKARIIPVDSEQSAIWQCLDSQGKHKIESVYLTASGGPLRNIGLRQLRGISVAKVLRHPRWSMGKKISVDSANLMNKGLELLEAMFLFNLPFEKIKIIIHPEAIIHSMVEFADGVIIAQLSATDMRIPIQYALSYPERLSNVLPRVDFFRLKALRFERPDLNKFVCLGLAYRAAKELGTMPCVLNAANEVCVDYFLSRKISFLAIPKVIEKVMNRHRNTKGLSLDKVLGADRWARQEAQKLVQNFN